MFCCQGATLEVERECARRRHKLQTKLKSAYVSFKRCSTHMLLIRQWHQIQLWWSLNIQTCESNLNTRLVNPDLVTKQIMIYRQSKRAHLLWLCDQQQFWNSCCTKTCTVQTLQECGGWAAETQECFLAHWLAQSSVNQQQQCRTTEKEKGRKDGRKGWRSNQREDKERQSSCLFKVNCMCIW